MEFKEMPGGFTIEQKKESVRRWRKAVFGKFPYIILGYIFYPFINRSKVREKYYSSDYNWYTLQLWYMINDDEWLKNGPFENIDYDVSKVWEKGIATGTRWGRFKASYWFNAVRNPAYNRSRTMKPLKTKSYSNQEVEIDEVYIKKGAEDEEKINPLLRAEWRWIRSDGKIDNMGEKLSMDKSRVGEGLVWFNPNNDPDILDFRYSKAYKKTIFGRRYYITHQRGDWGNKYDILFKIQRGDKKPKTKKAFYVRFIEWIKNIIKK
jgi:hypothetical protein